MSHVACPCPCLGLGRQHGAGVRVSGVVVPHGALPGSGTRCASLPGLCAADGASFSSAPRIFQELVQGGRAAYQNLCLESQCSGSGLQTRAERLLAEFRLGLYAAGVEAAGATGNGIGLGPRRGAWYERRAVVGSPGSWFRFQLDIGRTVTGLHTQVRADCEV